MKTTLKAILFCLGILCFLSGCQLYYPLKDYKGNPVEPHHTPGQEDSPGYGRSLLAGRYSLVTPAININNVDISPCGQRVMVSSQEKAVLLDREGKLLWEYNFDQPLVRAQYLPGDNRVVAGTQNSRIRAFQDNQLSWEKYFNLPLNYLEVSMNMETILLVADNLDREIENSIILLLDDRGEVQWQGEVSGLISARLSPRGASILLLTREEEVTIASLLDREGNIQWQKKGIIAAEISPCGHYAAASTSRDLSLIDRRGSILWSYKADIPLPRLVFSRDGSSLLAYNPFGGGADNLYKLNITGDLLWKQRIRDDSLLAASQGGEKIVVASWRHYSEDYTLVMLLDGEGCLVREIEVASRAEQISLSQGGEYLVLGCDDGNVYILNLKQDLEEEFIPPGQEITYYAPAFQAREDDGDCRRVTLYFYDETARVHIPVSRSITKASDLLRASIDELVRGPRAGSFLARTIPRDIDIGVRLEEGTVILDLPPELEDSIFQARNKGVVNSLLYTVKQFPTVEKVRFLVGGEERDLFGSPGIYIGEPFTVIQAGAQFPTLYVPFRSGPRYYLVPQEIDLPGNGENPGMEIAKRFFQLSAGHLPQGIPVRDLKTDGEVLVIDLGREFAELLKSSVDPENTARTRALIDGLTVTLTNNLPQEYLQVLVEGEKLPFLPGFLDLGRPLVKPAYINPE